MRYLLFLPFLLLCTRVPAQTHESLALQACLHGCLADWDAAISATSTIPDPETRLLVRAEYQLSRAYAAIAHEDDESRDAAMDDMEEALDRLWDINDKNAVAHGLYSGLLGLKVARNPVSGMVYGGRAQKYAAKGLKLGPHDPAALHHAAANLYYTPEQWGGDPEQAASYLGEAIERYGPDRDQNYRYLNSLVLLGQVQAKIGQADAARITYGRALEAQPAFGYVSRVLLPRLDK